MDYFTLARSNMVKNQLMTHHVNDERILDAMLEIPRHLFVEGKWQSVAYSDGRLALENNRTMASPNLQARMIQALELKGSETVLDIACGTGYTTAVLSRLCGYVFAVESEPSLAVKAAHNLTYLKQNNVAVKNGDLLEGAQDAMPFDAILINGAIEDMPERLCAQLKNGGKLVTVIKYPSGICKVVRFDKYANNIGKAELFDGYADAL